MECDILNLIRKGANEFLGKSKNKEIYVVSQYNTDGIVSAAIMIKSLKRLDRNFSVKIIKSLDKEFIDNLPRDKLILFLDLASQSLDYISQSGFVNVFVIDHSQINQVPENIFVINPELCGAQKMSSSCLTYLFCKEFDEKNKEFAKLAVLGMIGDKLESEIDKMNNNILNDSEIKRKMGLLIHPCTRPLNRALEFCSHPYINGVTGNIKGVLELLRESGLNPLDGKYPSILDLDDDKMKKLVNSIILRNSEIKEEEILGDIFLIKLFNKLEDAREICAIINACLSFGESGVALQFCMEMLNVRKQADSIHAKYKQSLIAGLRFVNQTEKIQGNGYVIINGREEIKNIIAGTIIDILTNSKIYEEGTVLIIFSYSENDINVLARVVGSKGRNVYELLTRVIDIVGGEVEGGECAARGNILIEKEEEFLELLKKNLEIELVRV